MSQASLGEFRRFLQRACALQGSCDLPDHELLERYISNRDEGAFTFLVRRHGPMILGVGRGVLGDSHEAEDIVQATFLVLVRRRKSIGGKRSVGGWLHGVAQNIALKTKAKMVARRHWEREAGNMRVRESVDDLTLKEMRSVLDEEISSLPDKYRTAVVLCCLEGRSLDKAAGELGCPKTSLTRLLTKARELLRVKLERRGITFTAGVLAASLAKMADAAPLPASLTIQTVKAATLMVTGKAVAAGCISGHVLALVEEAMRGMLWVKAKMILMVMGLGLAVGGAGFAGYGGLVESGQSRPGVKAQASAIKKQAEVLAKEEKVVTKDQYGDPLPEGAVARLGALRFRNEGFAMALTFTPDGKSLVGSTVSGVLVWDAATGIEKHRLPVGIPSRVAVSPNGTILAISELISSGLVPGERKEAEVGLWDLRSGKKIRTLLSPQEGKQSSIHFLSFFPDGKHLAVVNNNEKAKVDVYDLASDQVVSLGDMDFFIINLTISPDGKTLATAVLPKDPDIFNANTRVQLWDIATKKMIRAIPLSRQIRSFAFSSDGKTLACGTENQISLFDPATGKGLGNLDGQEGSILGLAFTPDDKKLVSGGIGGKVYVWDTATHKVLNIFNGRVESLSMALSPNGQTVALGTMGQAVQLWDVVTGKKLFAEYEGPGFVNAGLAYSPDGQTLVSAEEMGSSLIWDTENKKRTGILLGGARSLSFSPDGKKLATLGIEPTQFNNDLLSPRRRFTRVQLWDVASAKMGLEITVPDAKQIFSVTFAPDGKKLFTLDWNQNQQNQFNVRHWDVATGKQDKQWTISSEFAMAFLAPDGKNVLIGSLNGGINIFDLESGRVRLLSRQDKKPTGHLKLSPDAKVLAAGSVGSHEVVCLWELTTGKVITLLKGHQGEPGSIAWSPSGRLIATGDRRSKIIDSFLNQSVRVWDAATGKELASFGGFKADVWSLTFAPDGKHLAVGLRDTTVLIYDVSKIDSKMLPTPKLSKDHLESCWTDLLGDNAGDAHMAIGKLVASAKQSVPFLQAQLKPVALADQTKIQKWIADLDSENFAIRQTAARELKKVGDQVQVPIQKALKGNPSLETCRRLEQVLKSLPDIPGPEIIRTIRAIIALERIGTIDARGVLEALAGGAPGARETEESRGSLERLARRAGKAP